jgi:hypothetical protein
VRGAFTVAGGPRWIKLKDYVAVAAHCRQLRQGAASALVTRSWPKRAKPFDGRFYDLASG